MDTIFMNSGNSKTSDPRRLLLDPSDKRNLNKSDKYVALSNLSIHHKLKINKKIQEQKIYNINSNVHW